MPTARQFEQALYDWAPGELASDWDNVGLLAGDPEREIHRVLVALDVTEAVVEEAVEVGADLIVSHHPLMNCKWQPVQTLREDTPQGHLLRRIVQRELCVISMHTNLDAADGGVNDVLAETLKLVNYTPFTAERVGRAGWLDGGPVSLEEFVHWVCAALGCNGVRYADAGRPVARVAVGGGACGDFIRQAIDAGCDTFVTSDLSYHQFLDAPAMGINLIDAGHFPTEDVVCPVVIQYLQERFPEAEYYKSYSHREVIQYYTQGE